MQRSPQREILWVLPAVAGCWAMVITSLATYPSRHDPWGQILHDGICAMALSVAAVLGISHLRCAEPLTRSWRSVFDVAFTVATSAAILGALMFGTCMPMH